ncbi:MAG: gamma-glutamyl kinase, partial [Thaumarchaeota archaeon]|nr:gamma-glutamyl kinase [Nitrososphaerota archaeon]
MILIKLGGSIITNKERPLTPNIPAIKQIATQLRKVKESCVVVHGGGSFGHYWSVRYDMHTKPAKYSIKGVAIVKNSMVELNQIVLQAFLHSNLFPYCLPPMDFILGDKPIMKKIKEIPDIAKSGLTPVSYGDVMWFGKNKFYILSGDKIMGMLTKILKPRMAIFVTNVDGVYSNIKTGKLIHEITNEKPIVSDVKMDVTGGMNRKIKEAMIMSNSGTDVFFV